MYVQLPSSSTLFFMWRFEVGGWLTLCKCGFATEWKMTNRIGANRYYYSWVWSLLRSDSAWDVWMWYCPMFWSLFDATDHPLPPHPPLLIDYWIRNSFHFDSKRHTRRTTRRSVHPCFVKAPLVVSVGSGGRIVLMMVLAIVDAIAYLIFVWRNAVPSSSDNMTLPIDIPQMNKIMGEWLIEGGVEVFFVSACHFIEINDIVFFTTFNALMMQKGKY